MGLLWWKLKKLKNTESPISDPLVSPSLDTIVQR